MLRRIYWLCRQTDRTHRLPALVIMSAISVLFATIFCVAQETPEKYYQSQIGYPDTSTEQLFSPSAGRQFYQVAHQIASRADTSGLSEQEARQVIIFLNTAAALDSHANYILTDFINIISRYPQQDYSQTLLNAVNNYFDESTDIETARKAFQYLLGQLNSREDREKLLTEQLRSFTGKNPALESELATMLGLLAVEKTDANTAFTYFAQAYNSNKYNRLAFTKLAELAPRTISVASYLEHLRLVLSENPLDLQTALDFAQYAEQFQLYDTAAETYQYCANLFNYLEPSQPLPSRIYMPWAINCYNSKLSNQKCLQIAAQLRQAGQFDLLLEAVAGKAAEKTGDTVQAKQILNNAERKALELTALQRQTASPTFQKITNFQRLAWFYCFALADSAKAIDWANKAYSIDPNSPMTAAILAYALVMNEQYELAKSIIDSYEHNQINTLALAKIQLAKGQKDLAIESLKSAIAKDPASLEAEIAKQILTEQGSVYIPPVDPDITLSSLESSLGRSLNPRFIQPDKAFSIQLNAKGTKFSYGSDFGGSLTITNNSAEPLVISDDGLFTGQIRIDVAVTGDINTKIPSLINFKIRPPVPIGSGRSYLIPLTLDTGQLREILFTYPQASLDIEFTVYIDPIDTDKGPVNRVAALPPAKMTLKRPRLEVSTKYLQNRLTSLSKGQQGQKIKTTELFTGLLREQYAIAQSKQTYKPASADWMPDIFISALVYNLRDEDWVIRVHTMAGLLSAPINYDLTNAVSENLNDTHWPCRLMALYLLAKNQGSSFNKVLDWTVKYDPHNAVKDMAVALGGAKPPTETKQEQSQKLPQTTEKTSEPNTK